MTEQPTSSPAAARLAWVGSALTALLLFFSFGPVGHPFWAFIALVPAVLASSLRPDWRTWRRASFATSWVLWIALLIWLRHVYPPLGWLGLVLLTAYCALYPFVWLLLLRWIFPACSGASLPARLLAISGLAGAWGLLEWTRSSVLSGFGWLPLAASQTGNPVMLSLCAWAGPIGLSIALVLFNLGLARWIVRLIEFYREEASLKPAGPMGWLRRLTPELYLGLLPIALGFLALLAANAAKISADKVSFSVGVVQTDFDPNAKWDPARLQEHLVLTEALRVGVDDRGDLRPMRGRIEYDDHHELRALGSDNSRRIAMLAARVDHRETGRKLRRHGVGQERCPFRFAHLAARRLVPAEVEVHLDGRLEGRCADHGRPLLRAGEERRAKQGRPQRPAPGSAGHPS